MPKGRMLPTGFREDDYLYMVRHYWENPCLPDQYYCWRCQVFFFLVTLPTLELLPWEMAVQHLEQMLRPIIYGFEFIQLQTVRHHTIYHQFN